VAIPNYFLRECLERRLAQLRCGIGVVVCLPVEPDEGHLNLLLQAARIAVRERPPFYFVVLQHGWGGSAFARSLSLEHPEITTCVINVPAEHREAVNWIVREVETAHGFVEAYYDTAGNRYEPVLRYDPLTIERTPAIGSGDVLLITGGGKGIAA